MALKRALLLSLFLLMGCAGTSRKKTLMLRNLVQAGEYQKASDLIEAKDFYHDQESLLLKLLERGTLQYLRADYSNALKTFDEAKNLSDKLFTVSISKKIKAAVTNSNSDNYYGEKYERSMIRYYQALCHYQLFQDLSLEAKKRRFHLSGAKAVLLEWNSLLDNYKSTSGGVVAYKDDLLAKTFGAFIHEHAGTRADLRVALNLYKEAKKVLLKNYNTLETYNQLHSSFKKNLNQFEKLSLKKIKTSYIKATPYAQEFEEFLDSRIKELSKGKRSNLMVIIEKGMITNKTVDKVDFPIPAALFPASNKKDFLSFASTMMFASAGSIPKIYFELPKVSYDPVVEDINLIIKKNDKVVKRENMVVVNPLANLASMIMEEKSSGLYAGIGARVAAKHIAALLAAYATYRQLKKNGAEFMATASAALAYAASNKAIEASERADTRNWSLLPHHYRMSSLNLPPGQYQLILERKRGEVITQTLLGEHTLKKGEGKLLTFRKF